jgi:ATP-binding cassette subfamily F protein uup
LSYKERQEYKQLPKTIETIEGKISVVHATMSAPGFYKSPANEIKVTTEELNQMEQELEMAMLRWEELSQLDG